MVEIKSKFYHGFFAVLGTLASVYANATGHTPTAPDEIIAHWPANRLSDVKFPKHPLQTSAEVLQIVNTYLQQAALPGNSRLYGLAQAALAPLIAQHTEDPAIWLAWAQVQQHQHQFGIAEKALQQVLQKVPDNITANLLAARLQLIQGNVTLAKNTCLRLLGHSDLVTVSACTLEAASYSGAEELRQSYQQLSQLVTQGVPSDERGSWLRQILADMALRLEQPQTAVDWLNDDLAQAGVSQWAQWADAQLALQRPDTVIAQLEPLLSATADIEDALLLRLALAEKQRQPGSQHWQQQLAERVQLREQRGDTAHAADLAIFYLDIQPDKIKALQWAEENWRQAREPADQKLLVRAQAFNLIHSQG